MITVAPPKRRGYNYSITSKISSLLYQCRKPVIFLVPTGPLSIADLYLANVLLEHVHLWREFGLAIGLKPSTLEVIKSNNLKDVEICFTEVLASWLNGEDRSRDSPAGPNWEEVIAALRSPSLNMRDCAHQLLEKLAGRRSLWF